jgi:molybdopterin converting factor subunit 1
MAASWSKRVFVPIFMNGKTIHIQYFALLRERRGLSQESIQTSVKTARELYDQLKSQYQFNLSTDLAKVAVNSDFVDWNTPLKDGDTVVFIPPVSGG